MILHILRKDARRLWPAIAASLVLLALLAWHDRWRSDRLVGAVEGWLNILVPVAWAFLLALAVEQDAIAGDRQFWLTRPFRRRDLLAAKLLFAALFVHAPSFTADCYILAGRGFPPYAHLGPLLGKQAMLAASLTAPVMALASLVRSFAHFVLALVAVAGALVALIVTGWPATAVLGLLDSVRLGMVVAVGALASVAILGLQYFGRRVALSRVLGVAAGMLAALVFSLFLPQSALAVRAAMDPGPGGLTVRIGGQTALQSPAWGSGMALSIPIVVEGLPAGAQARISVLWSQIAGGGKLYREAPYRSYGRGERPPYSAWFFGQGWEDDAPKWMVMTLDSSVYASLEGGPVTLSGEAAVSLVRPQTPVTMRIPETRDFGETGRCTTLIAERRFNDGAVKVECESPRENPGGARVRLTASGTARDWKHTLGDARPFLAGPRLSWLSPLYRDVTYFEFLPEQGAGYGSEWRVPRDLVPRAQIEITRLESLGYVSLKWEFRDLDLRKYALRRPTNVILR